MIGQKLVPELTTEQLKAGRESRHARLRLEHAERKRKVAALLPSGMTRTAIARQLGLSRQTVHKIIREMTGDRQRFSEQELAGLNGQFENTGPEDVLRWVDKTFGHGAVQMSSFGLEDVALYDMYWRINAKARVMTLDTLRLPTETYTLFDQFQLRYRVEIETQYPDLEAVKAMINEKGFNLFFKGVQNRKQCCGVRKVDPLNRALAGVDAWVTGLRRDQGMERGGIDIVEWDEPHGNYKVNPLANWSFEDVREYVTANSVPYNELHDRGYPSLGCAPCTRAIEPGEDIRAGRWWWESDPDAKECGLHVVEAASR